MPTRTRRTDAHRPTALVTEDYEFAFCGEFGESSAHDMRWLLDEGWHFGDNDSAGDCYHCGAHLKYYAVLKHTPTHTLVRVGETCLGNRFDMATVEFHRLRKAAKLNRERATKAEKLAAWLAADEANQTAVDFLTSDAGRKLSSRNDFIHSLLCRYENHLPLSERQVDALSRFIVRQAEFDARKAAEAALPTAPVIEGKITVTGEVLSTKWHDNAYGGRYVMTVRDDRSFKLWGSVPTSLIIAAHHDADGMLHEETLPASGDRIKFNATVTRSDRDDTFGFFRRPTKAELI